MSRPPFESGAAGMTRRNYLVERNRLRAAQYEPTRKAYEEEELRLAQKRLADREERRVLLKTQSAQAATGADRPLPGGGPRSQRMKDTADQRHIDMLKQEKEEEARKKKEYQRLYNADMKDQLRQRTDTLNKMRADEQQQVVELRELNAASDRRVAEADQQFREEQKAYLERLRQFNLKELDKKNANERAQQERELAMIRSVQENNRLRADIDIRREKDTKRMLQLQNEEYHKMSTKRHADVRAREAEQMAENMERDRRLAQEEREASEAKKERFRQEFDDAVTRDKEFRRLHNYDEPEDVIRRRNELAAASYRLIQQEERLRDAERKSHYESELITQMAQKQAYELKHLDGL